MSKNIIGIDIRREAVSAVSVKTGIKGSWIEIYARIPVSAKDDEFENSIASAIESITAQMDVSGSVCIAAIPAEDAAYRNLKAPFKERKKIRQILPFELETDLPYSAEDIMVDFSMIHSAVEMEGPDLFAAVVEKQRVDFYMNLLKQYGIEPDKLTIGGYAIGQYLTNYFDEKRCQMVLDFGYERTTMLLSLSGNVCLLRSIAARPSNTASIENIRSQIARTLSAFEQNVGIGCDLEEIWLTGYALDENFSEADFEKFFGAPATRTDLLTGAGKITLSSNAETWQSNVMDSALALVLNELSGFDMLNFRQGRLAVEKAWGEHKRNILKTGILAGVVVVLFFVNSMIDYYALKRQVETKKMEVVEIFKSTFPEVKNIVDPVHQMRLEVEAAGKEISSPGELEDSVRRIDILNDISRFIPAESDVELISIVIGSDNLIISGNTDTFNTVDDMKSGLEKAEAFSSVSISSANMDPSGSRVRFKLKVTL